MQITERFIAMGVFVILMLVLSGLQPAHAKHNTN